MANPQKQNEKIDYLEYPSSDLNLTKKFFSELFNWKFIDYGPDYVAFENAGIEGGFYRSDLKARSELGSALTVFYCQDIVETRQKVIQAGAKIIKEIFEFPGGKRFHFEDLTGNEFAVWTPS